MPISPQMRAIWDAMRPAYQNVLGGSMTPEEGAAYQQELAVQKVAELFEGQDVDRDAVNITAILVYLAGLLLAIWALYKLFVAFILPLVRGIPGVQVQESRFGVLMVAPAPGIPPNAPSASASPAPPLTTTIALPPAIIVPAENVIVVITGSPILNS